MLWFLILVVLLFFDPAFARTFLCVSVLAALLSVDTAFALSFLCVSVLVVFLLFDPTSAHTFPCVSVMVVLIAISSTRTLVTSGNTRPLAHATFPFSGNVFHSNSDFAHSYRFDDTAYCCGKLLSWPLADLPEAINCGECVKATHFVLNDGQGNMFFTCP
jgi:hypothetical protein